VAADRADADVVEVERRIGALRRGVGRLIDGFAEGLIERMEFEPRVADLRARIAQLEEQRTALAAAAEARRDLTLVIGRLADFSTQVRQNLDLFDWATRRDVIRLMVRRIEIDDEQIEIVFRIPPLSGGPGGDHASQPTQRCPGERGTHLRLVGALPTSGQGLRGAHAHAPRLCSTRDDPPHDAPARKSLPNLMNSPDRL